jgi:hypothetical protein
MYNSTSARLENSMTFRVDIKQDIDKSKDFQSGYQIRYW